MKLKDTFSFKDLLITFGIERYETFYFCHIFHIILNIFVELPIIESRRFLLIPMMVHYSKKKKKKKTPQQYTVRALHSLPCSTPPGCFLKSCPLTLNYCWPWLGSEHMLLSHLLISFLPLCQLVEVECNLEDYVNKSICTIFLLRFHI